MTRVTLGRQRCITAYHVLGCPPGASAEELHSAYLELAREYAPRQLGDDEARMSVINAAWGLVKMAAERKLYNAKLTGVCVPCTGRGRKAGWIGGRYTKDAPCDKCGGTGWS